MSPLWAPSTQGTGFACFWASERAADVVFETWHLHQAFCSESHSGLSTSRSACSSLRNVPFVTSPIKFISSSPDERLSSFQSGSLCQRLLQMFIYKWCVCVCVCVCVYVWLCMCLCVCLCECLVCICVCVCVCPCMYLCECKWYAYVCVCGVCVCLWVQVVCLCVSMCVCLCACVSLCICTLLMLTCVFSVLLS